MIEYALLVFILIREYLHWQERKTLIEMALAKDLPEFKEAEKKSGKPKKDKPVDLMPEDQVSDEMFGKAVDLELGRETLADRLKGKLKKHGR